MTQLGKHDGNCVMAFSWSYSKIKNYETCPKRYYEVDVSKQYRDSTENLDWGNRVHDALAKAITGKAVLPAEMKPYRKYIESLHKLAATLPKGGEFLVEQKFALTKELQPCDWFGPLTWYRGIGDFVGIAPPKALILDWKTGRIVVDSKQLMLMAQCVFAFHPDVNEVDSGFVWLKENAITCETYRRDTIRNEWLGMLPRVQRLANATAKLDFPPQPNRLCARHCPVSSCPYHGKHA